MKMKMMVLVFVLWCSERYEMNEMDKFVSGGFDKGEMESGRL